MTGHAVITLALCNALKQSRSDLHASLRSENATIPRWLAVHHTRGGTLSEGRGTGCHSTLPRNSAAVLAARALVPNSIDDGVGAFEHKARTLGEAAVVVCRRALSRGGCVPAPQS